MKKIITLTVFLLSVAATSFAAGARVDSDLTVNGTLFLNGSSLKTTDGLLRDKGAWIPGTLYSAGDIVQVKGSSYVSISPSIDNPPPDKNWSVLASQGAKGDTGPSGPSGPALNVVDGNGTILGIFVGISGAHVSYFSNGKVITINTIQNTWKFSSDLSFTTTDCTGTAYIDNLEANHHLLYAISDTPDQPLHSVSKKTPVDVTVKSKYSTAVDICIVTKPQLKNISELEPAGGIPHNPIGPITIQLK
jgi:hypothetical protein